MDHSPVVNSSSPALLYDGRIGELYRIFLLNLLLTILTLGIFRFWAVTRYRRYIWSRMRFQGDRFEYTGTGGELFVGYLLAGLVLIGIAIAAGVTSFLLAKLWPPLAILPMIMLYILFGVLAAGAIFSAQRYRLSRTLWRGIRGGMTGSMVRYGIRAILYGVLALMTLLQLVPWMQVRLAERRINASSFGNAPFSFRGRAGRLYLAYLVTLIATIILFAIVGTTVWSFVRGIHLGLLTSRQPADVQAAAWQIQRLIWAILSGLVVFGILAGLVATWYTAMFARHVAGNTTLASMHFASSITGRALFGLMLGNLLIMLFTLGLGYPVLLHRNVHFLARTLWVAGTLDASLLTQSSLRAPRFGEGMFEQLDAGGVF